MKKILTLLLAAGAFITVQAQSKEETRRVILGGGNGSANERNYPNGGRDVILGGGRDNEGSYPTYPNSYPSNSDRQYQIDQVNREYDAKIQSIRNNGYLSYDEKQRAIRQLEKDRQKRLEQISSQYNSGRYNDRHDNGKHKGWYKKDKNKNWKKGHRD